MTTLCADGVTYATQTSECPIIVKDCIWSAWTLSPCSTTCGGGTQTKTRVVLQAGLFGFVYLT